MSLTHNIKSMSQLSDFDIDEPESINSKQTLNRIKNDALLFEYRLKNYQFMSEIENDTSLYSNPCVQPSPCVNLHL